MRPNVFVLADDYSDSANRIARYLKSVVSSNIEDISDECEVLIRYGITTRLPLRCEEILEINTSEAICNASHKANALIMLDDAGVPVPQYWNENQLRRAVNQHRFHFPVVLRPCHHQQGREFYMATNAVQLDEIISRLEANGKPFYGIKFINVSKEYRVLVLGNRIISVDRKQNTGHVTDSEVRNIHNGWEFTSLSRAKNPKTYKRIGGLGLQAVQVLGLDFGASDIVRDQERQLYVLEVNTAMGLRVGKARRLVEQLINQYQL